jgi:hypothetical protein
MSVTAAVYAKTRAEIIALFGWNAGALSPEQMLRADCATALRLGLDALQGALIRGESVDMAKMLTASEALARLLPPAVLAAPPAERREDPRKALLEMILTMRARGALSDRAMEPITGRAAEPTVITPTEADVVPPCEIADRDPGMRPGPDDPAPPVTIEATAAPAADADAVDLRLGFNDVEEPWRSHMNRHYDPWADNR